MKIDNLKKIKAIWIVGIIILLFVVWGVYKNPDRKIDKANAELGQLIEASNSTMQKVLLAITNKDCFGDESIKNGKSGECVIIIRNIQDTFKTADKENLSKLETFYTTNQSSLDEETKTFIENNIKLSKSDAYANLMNAYDKYFTVYIAWHKYFRDIVGIKGVDNMNDKELMQAHYLAQDLVKAEEDLKTSQNKFSDYLHENFSKDFIDILNNYSKNLKNPVAI